MLETGELGGTVTNIHFFADCYSTRPKSHWMLEVHSTTLRCCFGSRSLPAMGASRPRLPWKKSMRSSSDTECRSPKLDNTVDDINVNQCEPSREYRRATSPTETLESRTASHPCYLQISVSESSAAALSSSIRCQNALARMTTYVTRRGRRGMPGRAS
ncbi:hypothetical protein M404DRAFT_484546 [Pisolithus tinctorius Marx 270]|uniref:Uncharacterized protein n=1 Tax=Pisolithus tinctorius Marx 270 TaxID=870435 RepID=A0A0C3PE80_PISTI|nr:hypothetical protein M404DRAFT_484546 [Pisolithus tinctorius Marx 270]